MTCNTFYKLMVTFRQTSTYYIRTNFIYICSHQLETQRSKESIYIQRLPLKTNSELLFHPRLDFIS